MGAGVISLLPVPHRRCFPSPSHAVGPDNRRLLGGSLLAPQRAKLDVISQLVLLFFVFTTVHSPCATQRVLDPIPTVPDMQQSIEEDQRSSTRVCGVDLLRR